MLFNLNGQNTFLTDKLNVQGCKSNDVTETKNLLISGCLLFLRRPSERQQTTIGLTFQGSWSSLLLTVSPPTTNQRTTGTMKTSTTAAEHLSARCRRAARRSLSAGRSATSNLKRRMWKTLNVISASSRSATQHNTSAAGKDHAHCLQLSVCVQFDFFFFLLCSTASPAFKTLTNLWHSISSWRNDKLIHKFKSAWILDFKAELVFYYHLFTLLAGVKFKQSFLTILSDVAAH